MDAAERFDELADEFRGDPRVTDGTGFGSTAGLRVDRKIFAMVMGPGLLLKLPEERVGELLAEGAEPFSMAGRKPMREWVLLPAGGTHDWAALMREAYAFVGAGSAR